MAERIYIIDLSLDGQNRYRHRHVLETEQWHPIVRYDSAHGFAHRDLLHPDGTETKTAFRYWDYAQVLTYGERDLKQNWRSFRQHYLNELARHKKK